jgi:hypothetical protein
MVAEVAVGGQLMARLASRGTQQADSALAAVVAAEYMAEVRRQEVLARQEPQVFL